MNQADVMVGICTECGDRVTLGQRLCDGCGAILDSCAHEIVIRELRARMKQIDRRRRAVRDAIEIVQGLHDTGEADG